MRRFRFSGSWLAVCWLIGVLAFARPAGAAEEGGAVKEGAPKLSRALNLYHLRSFKKPTFYPMGDQSKLLTRDFLTGWWGGARSGWWDNGVEVVVAYIADVFSTVSGGNIRNGTAYYGMYVTSVDMHTDAMGLWKGGMIHLTTAGLHGESVAYQYVGALNPVYYYDYAFVDVAMRVYELLYEQALAQGKVRVRVGQIYPYVLIGANSSSNNLSNGSFHYPTYIGSFLGGDLGRGLGPAFIAAGVGVQVRVFPNPQWTFFLQVEDGYIDPTGGFGHNKYGVRPKFSYREGSEIFLQASRYVNRSQGLPGTYSVGLQIHTGKFGDRYLNTQGQPLSSNGGTPRVHRGNYQVYLILEQAFWRAGTRHLTGFGKVVVSPEDYNMVSLNTAWGASWKGPVPARDRDYLTVGYSYTELSPALRRYQREVGQEGGEAEKVLEVTYALSVSPWLLIRPSFQRILDPGGLKSAEDATVIGASTRVSF